MGIGLGRDFAKFVDDMPRRSAVRVAHAEIDDVLAARARRRLHRVHLGEHVGRQALDAVKFLGHPRVLARECCAAARPVRQR